MVSHGSKAIYVTQCLTLHSQQALCVGYVKKRYSEVEGIFRNETCRQPLQNSIRMLYPGCSNHGFLQAAFKSLNEQLDR